MLPEFLLADNREYPDNFYVVHAIKPRFIIECDSEDFNVNQKIYWIDKEPSSTQEIEKLLELAENFYNEELDEIDAMEEE